MPNEQEIKSQPAAGSASDSFERIGYGHPPKHAQFKRGQSGNWSGRPKRRRTFKIDIAAALDALEPDGKKTKQQRIAEDLVNAARAGNASALKIVVPIAFSLDVSEGDGEGELTELQAQLIEDFDRREESADSTTSLSQDGSENNGGDND